MAALVLLGIADAHRVVAEGAGAAPLTSLWRQRSPAVGP